MTKLVRGLKDALQDKEPAQFVPVLENTIKELTKFSPELKFKPLMKMVAGITKEAQDLAKAVSAASDGGVKEVNDFVEKRLHDMKDVKGSYIFVQKKLKEMVINIFERFSLNRMLSCDFLLVKVLHFYLNYFV